LTLCRLLLSQSRVLNRGNLVPELPGCHTQAKSLDELQKRLKEAIRLYLEVEKDIPENRHFIGIQQIEVAW